MPGCLKKEEIGTTPSCFFHLGVIHSSITALSTAIARNPFTANAVAPLLLDAEADGLLLDPVF